MKRLPIPADRRVEARGILIHRFSLAANNTLPTKGWLSFHSLKIGSLPKRRESIRKGQMPHRVMNMELQIVNRIAIQFHSRANHQGLMHKSSTASVLPAWCLFHTRLHRSEGAMSLEGRQYCEWMALSVYQRYRCLLEQRLCIPVNQAFSSMNRAHTTPIL